MNETEFAVSSQRVEYQHRSVTAHAELRRNRILVFQVGGNMVERGRCVSPSLPTECTSALAERLSFDSRFVHHRDEQIAQRSACFVIDVLAMFEATTSQKDGQVASVVRIGVAEVAAEQN